MIISGGEDKAGSSAEVFVPSTGKNCRLPDMPGSSRAFHTMEKMMMCGGDSTKKSCLTLIDGIWKETTTLLVDRYNLTVFPQKNEQVRETNLVLVLSYYNKWLNMKNATNIFRNAETIKVQIFLKSIK